MMFTGPNKQQQVIVLDNNLKQLTQITVNGLAAKIAATRESEVELHLNRNEIKGNTIHLLVNLLIAIPKLSHLSLAGNFINNENLKTILAELSNKTSLRSLNLCLNNINDSVHGDLITFAKSHNNLLELKLDGNFISQDNLDEINSILELRESKCATRSTM